MENKYSIQYNENTKKFSVKSQRLESAYSYKTPEQFIRERGYKLIDELTNEQIYNLGIEYISNQIVRPDEKLLTSIINRYYNICKNYMKCMHVKEYTYYDILCKTVRIN